MASAISDIKDELKVIKDHLMASMENIQANIDSVRKAELLWEEDLILRKYGTSLVPPEWEKFKDQDFIDAHNKRFGAVKKRIEKYKDALSHLKNFKITDKIEFNSADLKELQVFLQTLPNTSNTYNHLSLFLQSVEKYDNKAAKPEIDYKAINEIINALPPIVFSQSTSSEPSSSASLSSSVSLSSESENSDNTIKVTWHF